MSLSDNSVMSLIRLASRFVAPLCTLGAIVSMVGCFASQPSKPAMDFPKLAELQTLTAGPPPTLPSLPGRAAGDGWRFTGPLPQVFAAAEWQPASQAESHLAMALQAERKRSRFTQAMAGVARELGLFFASEGKVPQDEWNTFLLAACGSTAPFIAVGTLQDRSRNGSDAEIAKAAASSFRQQVRAAL